ncbi:MAG: exosome complex RNA-binding protein Rrp4, partial [Candidatus Ranarchaeia archaeon]
MSILFKERELAVPGDLLAEGNFRPGEGVYKKGDQIIASKVGLVTVRGRIISLIPLLGPYIPQEGDFVIGKIVDTSMSSWKVDINAPYLATLSVSNAFDRNSYDSSRNRVLSYYQIGDMIFARIISQDRIMGPSLTIMDRGLGKLKHGRIIEFPPAKIPRLVGRRRSMINMLEKETNTRIEIGQNGLVWISGRTIEDELLVEKAARMVELEAHTSGLT